MKKLYTIKPLEWVEFTHECGTVKYSAFTIGATYNIFYYDDGSIELDEYFARERNAQRLSCYSIEVAKQKANELWRRRVEKDLTEAIQTEVEATFGRGLIGVLLRMKYLLRLMTSLKAR